MRTSNLLLTRFLVAEVAAVDRNISSLDIRVCPPRFFQLPTTRMRAPKAMKHKWGGQYLQALLFVLFATADGAFLDIIQNLETVGTGDGELQSHCLELSLPHSSVLPCKSCGFPIPGQSSAER
jgi:hypothetical protein